jgi:hypothetical protein
MEVKSEDLKAKSVETAAEDVKLTSQAPRMFRNTLLHKALNFIYPSNKPKSISQRTFKEK